MNSIFMNNRLLSDVENSYMQAEENSNFSGEYNFIKGYFRYLCHEEELSEEVGYSE